LVLAITLAQNGTALQGKLAQPIAVTLDSLSFGRDVHLRVYDDATKAYGPVGGSSEIKTVVATSGQVSFDIASDPQIALVQPPARVTRASSTTRSPAPPTTQPPSGPATAASGGVLAFTGFSPLPLVFIGVVLMVVGEAERRRRSHRSRSRTS
jgi:hypothetical protein